MNPIIIPKKLLNKDIKFFKNEFNNNKIFFNFIIDNRNIENISNMIKNDKVIKNFDFFLMRMTQNNDFQNPLSTTEGGMPNNGFEFINKKTFDGLGIYHCHLSNEDKSVLIWYFIFDDSLKLKFEYIPNHPDDDYKSILERIYNLEYSFNLITGEFMNENKHLLMENNILKYEQFLNESNDTFGDEMEHLYNSDENIKRIIDTYLEDSDPTIRIANVLNLLDDKEKNNLKRDVDIYNKNGLTDSDVEARANVIVENQKNIFDYSEFVKLLENIFIDNISDWELEYNHSEHHDLNNRMKDRTLLDDNTFNIFLEDVIKQIENKHLNDNIVFISFKYKCKIVINVDFLNKYLYIRTISGYNEYLKSDDIIEIIN